MKFASKKDYPNLEKHSILSGGKWHEKEYKKTKGSAIKKALNKQK